MSDRRKPSAGGISGDVYLAAALAVLERASGDRLAEDWALYFGAMPRALRLRAVAYKMQGTGAGPAFGATGGSAAATEPGPAPPRAQHRASV